MMKGWMEEWRAKRRKKRNFNNAKKKIHRMGSYGINTNVNNLFVLFEH